MHIPGQGFSRVRIKTDRDSRIRFADLSDLQGQFFKGGSQKGTAENYDCKLSISVRYCVHALPLCLVWRAIVFQASFPFVILPAMVTRCFVKVAGTIVVSICSPSSSTFVSH